MMMNKQMSAPPKLICDVVTRVASGEALSSATPWVWDRADSDDRLAVDDWIVANNHPLGSLPSTRERRFRILADEFVSRGE
jgi:hypothetical protein